MKVNRPTTPIFILNEFNSLSIDTSSSTSLSSPSPQIDADIYLTNPSEGMYNNGLDNVNNDLICKVNDKIISNISNKVYIIKEKLGTGSFGYVYKCLDVENDQFIALKIIKNTKQYHDQSLSEINIVRQLNSSYYSSTSSTSSSPSSTSSSSLSSPSTTPLFQSNNNSSNSLNTLDNSTPLSPNKKISNLTSSLTSSLASSLTSSLSSSSLSDKINNQNPKKSTKQIVQLIESFHFQSHVCIVFELLSHTLLDELRISHFKGFTLDKVQFYSNEILKSLDLIESQDISHCDLKPENILIDSNDNTNNSLNEDKPNKFFPLKIIDFGLACFGSTPLQSYIQSRYYRAPEILLGFRFASSIDMWSFGCIVMEMLLGIPLFPGISSYHQLSMITSLIEQPPDYLIEGKCLKKFFTNNENSNSSDSCCNTSSSISSSLTQTTSSSVSVTSSVNSLSSNSTDHSNDLSILTQPSNKYRMKTLEEYAGESLNSYREKIKKIESLNYKSSLFEIISNKLNYIIREKYKKVSQKKIDYVINLFHDFVKGILVVDPLRRWTAKQLLDHPFLSFNLEDFFSIEEENYEDKENSKELINFVPFTPINDVKLQDKKLSIYLLLQKMNSKILSSSLSTSIIPSSPNSAYSPSRYNKSNSFSSTSNSFNSKLLASHRNPLSPRGVIQSSHFSSSPKSSFLSVKIPSGSSASTSYNSLGYSPSKDKKLIPENIPRPPQIIASISRSNSTGNPSFLSSTSNSPSIINNMDEIIQLFGENN